MKVNITQEETIMEPIKIEIILNNPKEVMALVTCLGISTSIFENDLDNVMHLTPGDLKYTKSEISHQHSVLYANIGTPLLEKLKAIKYKNKK